MLNFIEGSITYLFILLFIYTFSRLKVNAKKYGLLSLGVLLVTSVINYIMCFHGNLSWFIPVSIVNLLVIIGFCFLVNPYKDFRSLFVALTALLYALSGSTGCLLVYNYSRSVLGSLGVQIVINVLLYISIRVTLREAFIRELENKSSSWNLLCVIPFGYFLVIAMLEVWPNDITKTPSVISALICLILHMVATFIIVVNIFVKVQQRTDQYTMEMHLGTESKFLVRDLKKKARNRAMTISRFIMLVVLSFLVLAFIFIVIDNSHTNKGISSVSFEDCYPDSDSNSDITLEFKRRMDKDSTWTKYLGTGDEIQGYIYDAVIKCGNKTDLLDWYLKFDVTKDMYINKAWTGDVEISQVIDGVTRTQRLDLRIQDPGKIYLDMIQAGGEKMIKLNAGDSFIYYPNRKQYEIPMKKYSGVTIGFIFYSTSPDELPDVSTGTFYYRAHKKLVEQTSFKIVTRLFFLWLLGEGFLLGLGWRLKSLERQREKDLATIREVMESFAGFIDAKDKYTAGHSDRVAKYSALIARRLHYTEDEIKQVSYSGQLHDCGKIGIPGVILNKPEGLDDEEFLTIKSHTTTGYDILKNLHSVPSAAIAARYHHERYDGMGYPDGLKGEEIPLIARIICVADAFDAMNSTRVYRQKMKHGQIINQLKKNSGKQFDPGIIELFLEILKDGLIDGYDKNDFIED